MRKFFGVIPLEVGLGVELSSRYVALESGFTEKDLVGNLIDDRKY